MAKIICDCRAIESPADGRHGEGMTSLIIHTPHTPQPPAAMKYFAQGDDRSTLAVHRRREDGHAACGTRARSPHRGLDWWYDPRAKGWRYVVPQPVHEPITCGRHGCKG
jgi:hypothetical protein